MIGEEDDHGGGISGFGVAKDEETPLSGTGGAAGPGTRAGEGQPSGEGIGHENVTDSELAREAAALGNEFDDHDKTPALEYGEGDRPRGPTIGEALGSGAGTHVGSGTAPAMPIGGGKPTFDEGEEESALSGSPGGHKGE